MPSLRTPPFYKASISLSTSLSLLLQRHAMPAVRLDVAALDAVLDAAAGRRLVALEISRTLDRQRPQRQLRLLRQGR